MSDERDDAAKPAEAKRSVTADRLEALAKAAEARTSAVRWRSKQDGTLDIPEPSEVRSLTGDESAKAEAEASMRRLMDKQKGPGKGRRF